MGRSRKRLLPGRKRAHTSRAIGLVTALACAAMLTTGCSESHPSAKQASASRTFSAAEYKYASCMRAHGLPSLPRATVTDHEGQQVAFIGPSNAIDLMGAPQRIVRGRSPPVWIPMDFLRFL